jgi:protein-S-isoprenylcysteine O-methyltransferase Ste14
MIGFLIAFAVFCVAAVIVLRIVDDGRGTILPAVAVWLLYFFHADTVVAAAYSDVGRLPAPAAPFLVVGLATAAGGWLLFLVATRQLVRDGGFVGLVPSRLVTVGAFRLSRHPQNAGWAIMLLGVAIASRSVIALVFVAVFGVFSARLAGAEEAELERRHGAEYAAYRDRTPLLLGAPAQRPAT